MQITLIFVWPVQRVDCPCLSDQRRGFLRSLRYLLLLKPTEQTIPLTCSLFCPLFFLVARVVIEQTNIVEKQLFHHPQASRARTSIESINTENEDPISEQNSSLKASSSSRSLSENMYIVGVNWCRFCPIAHKDMYGLEHQVHKLIFSRIQHVSIQMQDCQVLAPFIFDFQPLQVGRTSSILNRNSASPTTRSEYDSEGAGI